MILGGTGSVPSFPNPGRHGGRPSEEMNERDGRKHPVHLPPIGELDVPTIIFVTVCTKDRKPLLASDAAHERVMNAWRAAEQWLVGRYVIMPDHVHLFCAPAASEAPPLEDWIRFWKSHVARHWNDPAQMPLWQRHFWDRELRRQENYDAKWDYVFHNPVRAGLVSTAAHRPYAGEINELRW